MQNIKNQKNRLFKIIIFFIVLTSSAGLVKAQQTAQPYTQLAPITLPSALPGSSNQITSSNLGQYFSQMYQLGVGVATALAVLMIILGGVEYVTTDAIGGKEEGKTKVQNAILGLLLALGSWIILNTINPAFLNTNLQISNVTLNCTNPAGCGPGFGNSNGLSTGNGGEGAGTNNSTVGALTPSQLAINSMTPAQQQAYEQALYDQAMGNPLTPDDLAAMSEYNTALTADSSSSNATGGVPNNGGNIAQNSLAGSTFPAGSGVTNAQVLNLINQSGLTGLSPSDASNYFPNGQITAQDYESLLASVADSESGFNPQDNTNGKTVDYIDPNTGQPVYSEGLFSLSTTDPAVTALANQYGITPQQVISNPLYNTQAAINILKTQIQKTGSIAGNAGIHYWGPLYKGE